VLLLAIISCLDLFAYSTVFPLLPYYAAQYGATATQTGMLIGSFALSQMLSTPLLGRVSDSVGRKPILLLTTGGTVAGFVIFALSNSLPLLFVARLVDGATGGNIAASQAYISDLVKDTAGRAQAFAWLAVAGSLGFVLGPAIGGALASGPLGLRAPPLLAACIAVLNWLLIACALPESTTAGERAAARSDAAGQAAAEAATAPAVHERTPWSLLPAASTLQPRVALLLALRVIWSLPFNALFTTFSLFLSLRFGLTPASTGRVLALAGALQIGAQAGAVAPLTRRFGEDTLLLGALGVGGASLGLLATAPSLPWLLAALVPTALASAVFGTVASAALSAAAGRGQTGGLLGLSFGMEAATRVVAPVLAGALTGALGASATGLAGAALVGMALPFAAMSMRRQQEAARRGLAA